MLDKQTLDILAEQMYLQERLEELRKQDAPRVFYDNKTTPLDAGHQKATLHEMLWERGFIDSQELLEKLKE